MLFSKTKIASVNFWTVSFHPEFLIIFDEACPQVWFHLKARQTISGLLYYRCSMHFLPESYREDLYLYSNNKLLFHIYCTKLANFEAIHGRVDGHVTMFFNLGNL